MLQRLSTKLPFACEYRQKLNFIAPALTRRHGVRGVDNVDWKNAQPSSKDSLSLAIYPSCLFIAQF